MQIQPKQFPYKDYSATELLDDFNKLLKIDPAKQRALVGLRLVEHFHPSIWACNVKNRLSPLEAWQHPDILEKVALNRSKYLRKDIADLSVFDIRNGLTVSKIAPRVSVFSPVMAKYLISKYLNEYKSIFDPCAGFSGRMLGALSLNKPYFGQDINSITVDESRQLYAFLSSRAKIANAVLRLNDSLYGTGEYECLFTCPPYADKENWHQDIEVFTAEDWIDICLKNFKCKAYLFIVDDAGKYSRFIVEQLRHKSHFATSVEYAVLIKR